MKYVESLFPATQLSIFFFFLFFFYFYMCCLKPKCFSLFYNLFHLFCFVQPEHPSQASIQYNWNKAVTQTLRNFDIEIEELSNSEVENSNHDGMDVDQQAAVQPENYPNIESTNMLSQTSTVAIPSDHSDNEVVQDIQHIGDTQFTRGQSASPLHNDDDSNVSSWSNSNRSHSSNSNIRNHRRNSTNLSRSNSLRSSMSRLSQSINTFAEEINNASPLPSNARPLFHHMKPVMCLFPKCSNLNLFFFAHLHFQFILFVCFQTPFETFGARSTFLYFSQTTFNF